MKRYIAPMKRYRSLLLIGVLPLLALRCATTPDDPAPLTLPAETQEGKNTFGCYLDGKLWLREYATGMGRGMTLEVGAGRLFLLAYRDGLTGSESAIKFDLCQGFRSVGQYSIFFPESDGCRDAFCMVKGKYFHADSLGKNILTITRYDSVARVLSGRFHFTAVTRPRFPGDTLTRDTVRLTDGRFDLRY